MLSILTQFQVIVSPGEQVKHVINHDFHIAFHIEYLVLSSQ